MQLVALYGLLFILTGPVARAAPPQDPGVRRVRALVRQLDDPRYRVRRQADRQLRLLGEAALPLLRAELARTPSLEVYRRLEQIIQHLRFPEQIRALVADLGGDTFIIREQADRKLRSFGKRILPQLKTELARATDVGVRVHLIDIIGDLSKVK
jgi:hypothetical protein